MGAKFPVIMEILVLKDQEDQNLTARYEGAREKIKFGFPRFEKTRIWQRELVHVLMQIRE